MSKSQQYVPRDGGQSRFSPGLCAHLERCMVELVESDESFFDPDASE